MTNHLLHLGFFWKIVFCVVDIIDIPYLKIVEMWICRTILDNYILRETTYV